MLPVEVSFVRPVFMRDGMGFAGFLCLGLLVWLFISRKQLEDALPLGILLLAAGYFAYVYYREPRAILHPGGMEYAVTNRAFPIFNSETEIAYTSMRRLVQVQGRRDPPCLVIVHEDDGSEKSLRLTGWDLDGVPEMGLELSRRSGLPLEKKWSF